MGRASPSAASTGTEKFGSNRRSEDPGISRTFHREGTGLATLPELVQKNLRKLAKQKAGANAPPEEVERILAELTTEYERNHGNGTRVSA